MESLSLQEENIIKDIRNLFRIKIEQNYTAIKDKKLRQLKIEYFEVLRIFLSIKKKKTIIKQ